MDIHPGPRGRAALWQHTEPGFLALGVWTERKTGLGEDAEPLVAARKAESGLLAVFDGAGGAGASVAGTGASGIQRSNAWMAARAARGLLEDWYVGGAGSHAVTDHLRAGLSGLAPSGPRSRLGGSMRRAFPTTMAALVYQADRQHVWWEVLWAGDSRCYVADPETGLHQLSRDDTDSQDALELLTQDPPMTNMVCADRRFTVHAVEGGARLPCVLVCATDGFFGYVRTPAEFEHLLLDTLTNAQDGTHWAALITEAVTGFTGDDATLALVALGFTDFRDLRAHFRRRAEHLSAEHAAPMRSLDGTDRSALVAARTDSWRRYRPSYESRLPLKEEM